MGFEDFPYDGELLARPGQSLEQHLSSVRKAIEHLKFKIPFYSFPGDSINEPRQFSIELPDWLVTDLMKILVATHDFGKISPFFQAKIRKFKIGKFYEPLSYHTKTSAYFAFFLIDEYFKIHELNFLEPQTREKIENLFKILIPYAIINHHTPKIKSTFKDSTELPAETLVTIALIREFVAPHSFSINIPNTKPKNGGLTEFFINVIEMEPCEHDTYHYTMIQNALNRLFALTDFSTELTTPEIPNWEEVATDDFYDLLDDLEDLWEETSAYPIFMLAFLFLHSVLGDLDEWDARTFISNSDDHTDTLDWNHEFPIDFNSIEKFKHFKFNSLSIQDGGFKDIIALRNQLFEETNKIVIENISQAYIIEAPTGSAKTLAMLNLALRIAEMKQQRFERKSPRIIYALPFISITDQVGGVLEEILQFQNANPDEDLTIHHMSADFPQYIFESSFDEEKEEIIVGRAKASTRLWHSPIIATTFVSLMNIIFSGRKRNILRFHRLVGSIIILDEIQSLPPKYWDILSFMTDYLIRYMNVDFVIGSATNPKPLSQYVKNATYPHISTHFLQKINRYRIVGDLKPETIDQAIGRIIPQIEELENPQVMIVVNTKKSCRTIYDALLKKFPSEQVFLLSTWLRPFDRKKTISQIQNRLDQNLPIVLVATQVVEAGVDLDFKTVYRDFAPLDSIVQVAGRCNRNYKYKTGTIHLLHLMNEKGRTFSSFVYDKVSLEVTQDLLTTNDTVNLDELQIRKLIHSYFDLVSQRRRTSELLQEFNSSDLPTIADQFSLIEEVPSITISIVPQYQYDSLNFNSKLTIKILSIFSIEIQKRHLQKFIHHNRKISGTVLYIAIEEENNVYDPKGGFVGDQSE